MSIQTTGQPCAATGAPRVYAVSDLHVDYRANLEWVESLPGSAHPDDALIVAGDVSHDLALLARTLSGLRRRFARVFFVPGNHELWLRGDGSADSIHKFRQVLALCRRLGVEVEPGRVGSAGQPGSAWVVPLFSWYLRPDEGSGSLFVPKPGEDPDFRGWADDHFVTWPAHWTGETAARYFLGLNQRWEAGAFDAPVITFSHFLPRADLVFATPEERARAARPPVDACPQFNFSRVAGCREIDAQLRGLGARVHVYGHQHRNRWRVIDGVRYVSNCLGYPGRELDGRAPGLRAVWGAGQLQHAGAPERASGARSPR